MTHSQRFGVTLLALGVWVSVAVGIPVITDELGTVLWMIGGAILVLGALALATSPGRED